MNPNRIAVYLTAAAALLAGLAPAVANLDLSSTIGIVAGLGAILGVVRKWLDGWQKHEAALADPELHPPTGAARTRLLPGLGEGNDDD